jgi:hypothetical protein
VKRERTEAKPWAKQSNQGQKKYIANHNYYIGDTFYNLDHHLTAANAYGTGETFKLQV